MKQIEVEIIKQSFGKEGIAYLDGKVVFIPFSLKGDKLLIEIVEDKKDYSTGKIIKIITPSKLRIKPVCPNFSICGGCHYLFTNYSEELEFKDEIIRNFSSRYNMPEDLIEKTIPSVKELNYRSRINLHITVSNDQVQLGFYEYSSHKIINFEKCFLISDKMNTAIQELKSNLNKNIRFLKKITTTLKEIQVVEYSNNEIIIAFNIYREYKELNRDYSEFTRELIKKSSNISGAFFIDHYKNSFKRRFISGNIKFYYKIDFKDVTYKFQVTPPSFFQVNLDQINNILKIIYSNLEQFNDAVLLDIFGGVGLFSLIFGKYFKKVFLMELNRSALYDAKENLNLQKNTKILSGKAEKSIKVFRPVDKGKTVAIIDPPRPGLGGKFIKELNRLKIDKIIYISCKPSTFFRDLDYLSSHYDVKKIQPIDMFPKTYHIEVIGILERKNSSKNSVS
ncbi:23S rRNA (uracil(1939)-C(5))-methyltransferase RlmD [Candidatus Dependentiae bacterium]|nr:23S rRNA (uracil(1939)-C(5))-methyltransferase RlmD [Candidatus Dependentiae bacterium]